MRSYGATCLPAYSYVCELAL